MSVRSYERVQSTWTSVKAVRVLWVTHIYKDSLVRCKRFRILVTNDVLSERSSDTASPGNVRLL